MLITDMPLYNSSFAQLYQFLPSCTSWIFCYYPPRQWRLTDDNDVIETFTGKHRNITASFRGLPLSKRAFFICTLAILYLFQCHKRLRWERSSKYLLSLSKLSYIFILVRFLLTYVTTLEVLFLMNSVPLLVNLYDWEVSKTFKTGSSARYAELGNCSFTAKDDFPKANTSENKNRPLRGGSQGHHFLWICLS